MAVATAEKVLGVLRSPDKPASAEDPGLMNMTYLANELVSEVSDPEEEDDKYTRLRQFLACHFWASVYDREASEYGAGGVMIKFADANLAVAALTSTSYGRMVTQIDTENVVVPHLTGRGEDIGAAGLED